MYFEWLSQVCNWTLNSAYVFSDKQPNNEDVSLQYDDNIQDSKCHGESSSQKSEYYCELQETEYNDTAIAETEYHDTAIDNIYEAIWFDFLWI